MKKLFIVLAIASLGFASCGNEGDKKEGGDTTKTEAATPDTANKMAPDTSKMAPDTSKMAKPDTAKK